MLMEPGAFGAVNDVVLDQDIRAAFIGVNAPAAIGERVDIMDQVYCGSRCLSGCPGVNGAHVAQHALADIVKMIELDDVIVTRCFLIAPVPTHGNGGIIQVVNVIVGDAILTALEHQDPHRRFVPHPDRRCDCR